MTEAEKIDQADAKKVIDEVIKGQQRELYALSFKVKRKNPRNVAESAQAIHWIPVMRVIPMTEDEYKYLTEGMASDPIPQYIISQLLLPERGLTMSAVQVQKVEAS